MYEIQNLHFVNYFRLKLREHECFPEYTGHNKLNDPGKTIHHGQGKLMESPNLFLSLSVMFSLA